jgi:hypothetical protein
VYATITISSFYIIGIIIFYSKILFFTRPFFKIANNTYIANPKLLLLLFYASFSISTTSTTCAHDVSAADVAWELFAGCLGDCFALPVDSSGVLGASVLGGIRSFAKSRPLASAKDVILWFGENPCKALLKEESTGNATQSPKQPANNSHATSAADTS